MVHFLDVNWLVRNDTSDFSCMKHISYFVELSNVNWLAGNWDIYRTSKVVKVEILHRVEVECVYSGQIDIYIAVIYYTLHNK